MKKGYLILVIPIAIVAWVLLRHPAPQVEAPVVPVPVLQKDGLGIVSFGASPEDTIAVLTKALGVPTKDTGTIESFSAYGTCPGKDLRAVEWKNLYVLFGDTAYGTGKFYQYGYTNKAPLLATLSTNKGVTLGMGAEEIKARYPDAKFSEWLPEQDGVLLEARDPYNRADFLGGTFDENKKLYFIIGGIQCGE